MAELSITVQGVPALVQKLGAAVAAKTLERAMVKAEARVIKTLAKYPSPPSGSTYDRTGDLGRSWTSSTPAFTGGALIGTIGNAVRSRKGGRSYAPFVQSAEEQARVHQGRWITDAQALEQNRSAIESDFGDAIQSALS